MNQHSGTTNSRCCFAVVPAAGQSRRMGSPKLMLPWPHPDLSEIVVEPKVIDAVLHAWTSSRVSKVVVVVRADDALLRGACERWPVDIVTPVVNPVDMKHSLQLGLRYIEKQFSPSETDWFFVAPADIPTLSPVVIDGLMEESSRNDVDLTSQKVLIPRFSSTPDKIGKTGHPALLPWPLTDEIFRLPQDQGVDVIVKRFPRHIVDFPAIRINDDMDTPHEYQRLIAELDRSASPSGGEDG